MDRPALVSEAVPEWDAWCRQRGHRPKTREVRCCVVRAVYKRAGLELVDELTDQHAAEYLGRELSPASRRTYAVSLRAWQAWTGLDLDVAVPHVPRGLPRPARLAGINAAMLAAPQPVRCWIALGRYAGLRAGEVALLRGDDVDLVAGVMRIEGKGGQLGTMAISPQLARELAPHVEASDGGRLWEVKSCQVSARAGRLLREHHAAGRFHELRHYFGTSIYQSTGDILRAQRALRHASPTTTTIYALLADEQLAAAVAMVR